MLSVLTEIAEKARWKLSAFNGKLHLSGRVLSPIEAQAAGIASKTLISRMMATMKENEAEEMTLDQQIEKISAEDILTFGKKMKIRGTPTLIFADGRRVPGALSYDQFRKIVGEIK